MIVAPFNHQGVKEEEDMHVTNFLSNCSSSSCTSSSRNKLYKEDHDHQRVPVRAFFFSTSIDLKSLRAENQVNFIPPTLPVTNHVLLRFKDPNSPPRLRPRNLEARLSGSSYSYMVVFRYGSIVMFNIADREIDEYLKIIERHASGLLKETRKDGELFLQNKIMYEVRVNPKLPMWMHGGLDYIVLQQLNADGIRMIGSVLGQSVALDYYVRQVDGMMAEFTDVNGRLEKTGTLTFWQLLTCEKSSRLPGVARKGGLLMRSEIAWEEDVNYVQMWEYLQTKFEPTPRLAVLEFELRLAELNTSFYSGVYNRRSMSKGHTIFMTGATALFASLLGYSWDSFLETCLYIVK